MLTRALLTIAMILVTSGVSGEDADVGPCPLDFSFTLSSAARGDSVLVKFAVSGRNNTGADVEICGLFDFFAIYKPDDYGDGPCRSWPSFFVIDDRHMTPRLECSPVVIPRGGALSDTMEFDFKPAYFEGHPGAVHVEACFRHGRPGMPWNDSGRVGPERLTASVPVP